jgi:hypothetical protein
MVKFKVGDLVEIEENLVEKSETFEARITWIDEKEEGLYYGFTPEGENAYKRGRFGCAWEYNEPREYGKRIKRVIEEDGE